LLYVGKQAEAAQMETSRELEREFAKLQGLAARYVELLAQAMATQ